MRGYVSSVLTCLYCHIINIRWNYSTASGKKNGNAPCEVWTLSAINSGLVPWGSEAPLEKTRKTTGRAGRKKTGTQANNDQRGTSKNRLFTQPVLHWYAIVNLECFPAADATIRAFYMPAYTFHYLHKINGLRKILGWCLHIHLSRVACVTVRRHCTMLRAVG